MFQLDDKFLKDVGMGDLPQEQKTAFLQHIYEELELRVGTKLADSLTDAQLAEFEGFVDKDGEKVAKWLAENVPNYLEQEDYKKFISSAPQDTDPKSLAAEYASLKWLQKNRPDYKDVVASELAKLRQEVMANKDKLAES